MKRYINIIFIVLAWAFSTINTSGLGAMLDTPTKTNILIVVWYFIVSTHSIQKLPLRENRFLVLMTLLSFVILPYLTAHSWQGFTYLLMVPLVYCFSQQRFTDFDLELSGYIIALLGLFVMYVYSRTSILSGWNDNQISMIVLFSYIYYSITLYGNLTGRKLTIGLAISGFYAMSLMQNTDSRSGLIFILASVILAYRGTLFKSYIQRAKFPFYAVSVPLIIALVVVLFPNLSLFKMFDEWSVQNYGKSAFNGRDELWLMAWNRLVESHYLGEGKFLINHHNSAVAVLGVFGVLGYLCWYQLLVRPVRYIASVVDDNLSFGCLMGFLLIFWQQSFELGFVTSSPNMIPYTILGIGLARANYVKLYESD